MKKYTVWQENIEKVEVFGVEAESKEEAIRLVRDDDMYADAEWFIGNKKLLHILKDMEL